MTLICAQSSTWPLASYNQGSQKATLSLGVGFENSGYGLAVPVTLVLLRISFLGKNELI